MRITVLRVDGSVTGVRVGGGGTRDDDRDGGVMRGGGGKFGGLLHK